jgi:outer membrane protein assembly factor BamB
LAVVRDCLYQVVAVSGSTVTAFNSDTGSFLWNATMDGAIQGAPVAIDNYVFVGSMANPGDIISYDVNYQGSAGSGTPAWLNVAKSTDKFVVGKNCAYFSCVAMLIFYLQPAAQFLFCRIH